MKRSKMNFAFFVMFAVFIGVCSAQETQTNNGYQIKKTLRNSFPQFYIAPYGGAIFPLPKLLNQNFKPGANLNLDIGYRVNREVGFYGKVGYYFMSSKISGAPIGNYFEVSGGPRYYFYNVHLKSELFLEGGVGAYNFNQKSYANPNDLNGGVIAQINNTKAGLNGGIGGNLSLTEAIDIMVKSKYHVIFTPNGTTSFITVGGGLSFRFR